MLVFDAISTYEKCSVLAREPMNRQLRVAGGLAAYLLNFNWELLPPPCLRQFTINFSCRS